MLWTYSPKTGDFFNQFTVTVRISRMSRVSVVVRFSFGDWIVIGLPDMQ